MAAQEAVNSFLRLVSRYSYKGRGMTAVPLTNMTFFLGAGFSKAWDTQYPLAKELFEYIEIPGEFETLIPFFRQCGFDPHDNVTFDIFSESYYKLEMLKKYPQLMPRYIDGQTLSIVETEFKALIWQSLHYMTDLNYVQNERLLFSSTNDDQDEIIHFFDGLIDQLDGSSGIPEGIRSHFITTNYDFILEGILDSHYLRHDDYHYLHTYRGFTPKEVNGDKNISPLQEHWLVSNLIKINGGLEIRHQNGTFNIDHRPKDLVEIIDSPPEIILPSKEQDYTSNYFKSVFSKAIRLLQETQVLVIVGYSFPKEDALLRFILRHFAEDDRDFANKSIFYIDIGKESILRERVLSICPSDYFDNHVSIYNKGFANFVKSINKSGMP